MRLSVVGRSVACLLAMVGELGCGGSASIGAAPANPAYSVDCRAAAAAGAASASPGPGQYATMVVDGKLRDYRLYRPAVLDNGIPAPLVVILHGNGGDAADFEGVVHLRAEASADGFLAVYPDGCFEDWDPSHDSYDVDFVANLIDRLETEFHIDRSRVYVTGGSAGAFMTYRLACDLADRIAAIASVAGSMWWTDCNPARPISILEIHGTADASVPYQGGGTYQDASTASVTEFIRHWTTLDGCAGSPVLRQSGITKTSLWNSCNGGAVVRLDTIIGGHHTWFGSTFDPVPGEPDANTVIWNFLRQFHLTP